MNQIDHEKSAMDHYSRMENFCDIILNLNKAIRSVCIAAIDGKIRCLRYRKEVVPLLETDELQLSVTQSLIRASMRETLRNSLGKQVYSYTLYEKVQRITMPFSEDEKTFLMFSLDLNTDHQPIIPKILSIINKK